MDSESFNLRHLAALAAIAKLGTVSAAARRVNLTQPAVTHGIAKLERQLSLTLLVRGPGFVAATPALVRLAPRVDRVLEQIGSRRVTMAQMRAFVALARSGSYAGAALEVGLAQPSLHRAVGDLALALGVKLVERQGRVVVLTRQGRSWATRLQLAFSEIRSLIEEVAEIKGEASGRLLVGAMPLSRARLLPKALAAFPSKHPQARIEIIEGSYGELAPLLRNGTIDMMLGAMRDPALEPDFARLPLFKDRPIMVSAPSHPLTSGWKMEDLRSYSWILPSTGTPLRALWEEIFHGGALPDVPIVCGSVAVIRGVLERTDYLALLSYDQVAAELQAGQLAELGPVPGPFERTIGLTTRLDWRPTGLQAGFISALEQASAEINS